MAKPRAPLVRSGALELRRRGLPVGLAGLALSVAIAWFRQRCEVPTVLGAIVGLTLLIAALPPTWRRWMAAVALLDLTLLFAYLWSLDDHVHLHLVATPAAVTVTTEDGDSLTLHAPLQRGRVGLYAGDAASYYIGPVGEPAPVSTSPLASLGAWLRFAGPRPAWTDLRFRNGGSVHDLLAGALRTVTVGAWDVDRRGEYEGDLGSAVLLGSPAGRRWTLDANLYRTDGTQGVLVGVGPAGRGYLCALRLDNVSGTLDWFAWNGTAPGGLLAETSIHPLALPTAQRVVRLLLAGALAATVLIVAILALAAALGLVLPRVLPKGWGPRLPADWADTAATVLAGAALIATAVVSTALLQRIPHVQDSVAYLFQARTLALGRLSAPLPPVPDAFREEFILMYHGHWFGKYPPGWPAVLTLGVLAHAPWLVNPILSAVTVALLYALGSEMYGRGIGLLGALLVLSSPFFLFLGGSFMAHTSEAAEATGSLYLLFRWLRRYGATGGGEVRWLLPAGFLLGLAAATRALDAAAFALPFALPLLRRPLRQAIRAAAWMAIGAAGPILALPLYDWAVTGNPFTSPYTLWWPFDRLGFGASIGFGHTPGRGLRNTSYNLQELLTDLWGWPFYLTLALAAVPFLVGRAKTTDWLLAASAALIPIAYIFYWNAGVMYGPRYYFLTVPPLALLSARGLIEAAALPSRLPSGWRPDARAGPAAVGLLLAALLLYNCTVYLPAQVPMYRGFNYVSADRQETVARAAVHHALVLVVDDGSGGWWTYGSVFSANSPLLNGDVVYARDLGARDRQIVHAFPGRAVYRLTGTTLTSWRGP